MKNLNLTLSLALIFALASCQSLNGKSQQTKNIVATYKGGSVTSNEVNYELNKIIAGNDKLKNLTFDQLNKDQKEALVKEVVLKNSSYKEAKRRGLNKDSDYQEALKIFESDLLKQFGFSVGTLESEISESLAEKCKKQKCKGFYNSNNGIYAVYSLEAGYWIYRPAASHFGGTPMTGEELDEVERLPKLLPAQGYREDPQLPVRSLQGSRGYMADFRSRRPTRLSP